MGGMHYDWLAALVFLASLIAMTLGGRWLALRVPELRRMRDLNREADRPKLARPRYRAAVEASNRAGLATNLAFYAAVLPFCLNLAPRDAQGYATPPFGLRELLPHAVAGAVLQQVAVPVLQAVLGFEQFGFAPFQARFQARDALAGRPVRLSDGTAGSAHGVDGQGALLVHTAAGMKAVATAEVSVRPA